MQEITVFVVSDGNAVFEVVGERELWALRPPKVGKCELCGKRVAKKERVFDLKTTGIGGEVQAWSCHKSCLLEFNSERYQNH